MATTIMIQTGRNGYQANQVADSAMNIVDLIEELQEMADSWGEDAVVVVRGSGYGAIYEPVLSVVEDPEEDVED